MSDFLFLFYFGGKSRLLAAHAPRRVFAARLMVLTPTLGTAGQQQQQQGCNGCTCAHFGRRCWWDKCTVSRKGQQ